MSGPQVLRYRFTFGRCGFPEWEYDILTAIDGSSHDFLALCKKMDAQRCENKNRTRSTTDSLLIDFPERPKTIRFETSVHRATPFSRNLGQHQHRIFVWNPRQMILQISSNNGPN